MPPEFAPLTPQRPWIAIAAMAENRVIGAANRIPWHLPEDFKWFKATTLGGTLVMGRKTYESIGRPLPGRTTVVLSRTPDAPAIPGLQRASSLEAVQQMSLPTPVFICGGADLYRQALDRCALLLLTRVKGRPEGDAYFPAFEDVFQLESVLREEPAFRIERWLHRP